MDEVAEFLRTVPPFEDLAADELRALAAAAEVEARRAGERVLGPAAEPSRFVWVVRRGAVELSDDGRLLDLVGEGELFGYASMLAGLPPGFTARTAEPAVLYRMPESSVRPVLERPASVRFLVRSLAPDGLLLGPRRPPPAAAGGRPAGELVRGPALVCRPDLSVRDAAKRMAELGASCVVVEAREGLGIVTDRDLRTRVLAAGASPDTELAAVMTCPAHAVGSDRLGGEALMEMLDRGIRHLLVLDARRRLVGVLDDVDLMAGERRAPFRLRARIARAADAAGVAEAAAGLPAAVVDLHDARVPAPVVSRAIASIHDSVVRRLIELAVRELGAPPIPFTWLAMGSQGRREPVPASDADSALAWHGGEDAEVREALAALAERVLAGLSASGFEPCPQGAVASSPLFARSVGGWERAAAGWLADPDRDRGLALLVVATEGEPVWGATALAERITEAFARAPARQETLRRLAAAALALRPPTGFVRDFVLEAGGQRRGLLDIKRAGVLPIVNLARWASLSAGVSVAPTVARLEAVVAAGGPLSAGDAEVLREAFELICALRMEHQVERLRAGLVPDDRIDPSRLTRLTRRSLKEAFRAVGRVQRGVAVTLGFSAR